MPTVWSYNVDSEFTDRDYPTGWSHTLDFSSLGNLADQLETIVSGGAGLVNVDRLSHPWTPLINKLAIMVHGVDPTTPGNGGGVLSR